MKINKLFCIDYDLVESLNKIDNHSKLVNDLLKDYFSFNKGKIKINDQKNAKIKQLSAMIKQEKHDLRLIKFISDCNFDQFCVNWCYSEEIEEGDQAIENYIYRRKLKIKIEEFKKCVSIVKDHGHLFKKTG